MCDYVLCRFRFLLLPSISLEGRNGTRREPLFGEYRFVAVFLPWLRVHCPGDVVQVMNQGELCTCVFPQDVCLWFVVQVTPKTIGVAHSSCRPSVYVVCVRGILSLLAQTQLTLYTIKHYRLFMVMVLCCSWSWCYAILLLQVGVREHVFHTTWCTKSDMTHRCSTCISVDNSTP